MSKDFRSDNVAPPTAELLQAVLRDCAAWTDAYAEDRITARIEDRLSGIFEHDVAAFPILTGTAANALSLAQISGRFGQILCHRSSHIHMDECGAVEFQNPGTRLKALDGKDDKLDVDACEQAFGAVDDVHQLRTVALSMSQATEVGTFYSASEAAALAGWAKARDVAVHVDGTRFSNVVAASGSAPAALTWQAGVDVLCLGATKGGAIGAEVVIFFDRYLAKDFKRLMKRSGHLASRTWFLAAQLEAYFRDDLWLGSARHANAMAQRLGDALASCSVYPCFPVQTNMVFLSMSNDACEELRRKGFDFYTIEDEKRGRLVRLVTSHATQPGDVDRLAEAIAHAAWEAV